jgi:alpha-galactosidase
MTLRSSLRRLRVLGVFAPFSILLSTARAQQQPAQPKPAASILAATPIMGWNPAYIYAKDISDSVVRANADALVKSGLSALGYIYVNIDDYWTGTRDSAGVIHPNERFPDMKALADYIHSKGLKFGIYSSPGKTTCADYIGSGGHEEQDAETYAQWGVDLLKYDWCGAGGNERVKYAKMHDAILKTGRPMIYSLCQYGEKQVWRWGDSVGANMWRTADDIWQFDPKGHFEAVMRVGMAEDTLAPYAGPGHWNDPDILQIGIDTHMTVAEERAHMSLWALLAAPLQLGNKLMSMNAQTLKTLGNPEVIAVDQDRLGRQGRRIAMSGRVWTAQDSVREPVPVDEKDLVYQVWARPLADGSQAVGLFNFDDKAATLTVLFSQVGLPANVTVRDLWAHKTLGKGNTKYTVNVPAHGAALLKLTPRS